MKFGEHLVLDGYNCDFDSLDDEDVVKLILDILVIKLGMRKLADPLVFFAPSNNIKDPGGWSGFVILQESHISIHTFPKRGYLSMDVYTCKDSIPVEIVEECVTAHFGCKDMETSVIPRGTRYPDEDIF